MAAKSDGTAPCAGGKRFEWEFSRAFAPLSPLAGTALILYAGECYGLFEGAESLGVSPPGDRFTSPGPLSGLKTLSPKNSLRCLGPGRFSPEGFLAAAPREHPKPPGLQGVHGQFERQAWRRIGLRPFVSEHCRGVGCVLGPARRALNSGVLNRR